MRPLQKSVLFWNWSQVENYLTGKLSVCSLLSNFPKDVTIQISSQHIILMLVITGIISSLYGLFTWVNICRNWLENVFGNVIIKRFYLKGCMSWKWRKSSVNSEEHTLLKEGIQQVYSISMCWSRQKAGKTAKLHWQVFMKYGRWQSACQEDNVISDKNLVSRVARKKWCLVFINVFIKPLVL